MRLTDRLLAAVYRALKGAEEREQDRADPWQTQEYIEAFAGKGARALYASPPSRKPYTFACGCRGRCECPRGSQDFHVDRSTKRDADSVVPAPPRPPASQDPNVRIKGGGF